MAAGTHICRPIGIERLQGMFRLDEMRNGVLCRENIVQKADTGCHTLVEPFRHQSRHEEGCQSSESRLTIWTNGRGKLSWPVEGGERNGLGPIAAEVDSLLPLGSHKLEDLISPDFGENVQNRSNRGTDASCERRMREYWVIAGKGGTLQGCYHPSAGNPSCGVDSL